MTPAPDLRALLREASNRLQEAAGWLTTDYGGSMEDDCASDCQALADRIDEALEGEK